MFLHLWKINGFFQGIFEGKNVSYKSSNKVTYTNFKLWLDNFNSVSAQIKKKVSVLRTILYKLMIQHGLLLWCMDSALTWLNLRVNSTTFGADFSLSFLVHPQEVSSSGVMDLQQGKRSKLQLHINIYFQSIHVVNTAIINLFSKL